MFVTLSRKQQSCGFCPSLGSDVVDFSRLRYVSGSFYPRPRKKSQGASDPPPPTLSFGKTGQRSKTRCTRKNFQVI